MALSKTLSTEEIRKMQLLQLDMMVEFDRVCRENNINYMIWAGTQLGAVRHQGYIPWDDDADIAMLREDYDRFKETCLDKLNPDICFFQDHDTDPEYLWGFAKLRRTGTRYVRLGQEHIKCKTGVCVDVFPLDDVPKSLPGRMLQDFHCFCLRKSLWSRVGKYNSKGFMKYWYSLLSKIPIEFIYKQLKWYASKSRNDSENMVRCLTSKSVGKWYYKHPIKERYGIPKKWSLYPQEFLFEGKKLIGSKYYDEFLTFTYGDYMTPPPVDKRGQKVAVSDYFLDVSRGDM